MLAVLLVIFVVLVEILPVFVVMFEALLEMFVVFVVMLFVLAVTSVLVAKTVFKSWDNVPLASVISRFVPFKFNAVFNSFCESASASLTFIDSILPLSIPIFPGLPSEVMF